jgi:hemerythrin-like domain-containing protein
MAANVKAVEKKPAVVKKKAAARKANAAVKKKPAAAKKSATRRKTAVSSAGGLGKSDAGYNDRSAWDKKLAATAGKKAAEQPMMKTLRAEHRHMATVMQLFSEQLKAIEGGELVDTHVVYEIMDYMVTWPDRFHHPREDLIYARVAEINVKVRDDVDSLQRDHDHTGKRGREVLKDIERWRLGEVSGTVVVKSGRAYIDHIHEHMNLEEKLVFPRIETVLTLQDWRELAEDDQLRAVSDSVVGPQVQREFRNMTRKLRRGMRRSVERGTMVEWIGIEALMESLEVVSIAYESTRDTVGNHVRSALQDSLEMFREAPLSAPLRCVANNTRVTLRLLGEVADISRETLDDLSRVNQERKDRVRLMDRGSARR